MVRDMTDVRGHVMRRFWDAHSRGWDDIRSAPEVRAHVLEVVDWFSAVVPTGGAVIDVGCGPGHHAIALAERGFAVTAVDFSPGMLARARTKAREKSLSISFRQADLNEALPFAPETFDGALCVGVLQVIRNPAGSLERVRDLLRPGGRVLVEMSLPGPFVPLAARPGHLTDSLITRVKHVAARVPGVLRRYEPEELGRVLGAAGLSPVEVRTYGRTYSVLARR
jgi:SAM-dependent methyltransferase